MMGGGGGGGGGGKNRRRGMSMGGGGGGRAAPGGMKSNAGAGGQGVKPVFTAGPGCSVGGFLLLTGQRSAVTIRAGPGGAVVGLYKLRIQLTP
jgi:hypothetical protein